MKRILNYVKSMHEEFGISENFEISMKQFKINRIFLPYILRYEYISHEVTTWPHIVVYFVHTQPVNMVVLVQRLWERT